MLPFITKPKAYEMVRIGNPEIGELEIPKFGDLSVNERIFVKHATKHLPDLQQLAAQLAKQISRDSGMPMVEVYDSLIDSDLSVLGSYLDNVLDFNTKISEYTQTRDLAIATAILRRIAPDWTEEQTGDPTQLNPRLLTEVVKFGAKEEKNWKVEEPEPMTDETLGKSSAENTEDRSQTGEKSTGEFSNTGPMTDDSQPNPLDSNPSI
jgi:hypothetical protein